MQNKTVFYSQLSSEFVKDLLVSQYKLDASLSCKYYVLGLHDNYLVDNGKRKFILRIYRNSWRNEEEIKFELELLDFLSNKTHQVAAPLQTKTGKLAFEIECPEGIRMAALFHYADGRAPEKSINKNQTELLGEAVANIHQLTESFTSIYKRKNLDLPYLLDESLLAIKPFMVEDEYDYLVDLQSELHSALSELEQGSGKYGICIGDVNPTNFHITQNNHLTLFDFDQCGYGHRSFEIAKFFSSIHSHKDKVELKEAFLNAYQKIRALNATERRSIPYFEAVAVIWVMAIHAVNAERIGFKYLEKPFWDRKLNILKKLEADLVFSLIN